MTSPARSGASTDARPGSDLGRLRWSLLFGNFTIGCGVMVVAGSLNDLVRSLQVSVALGGQLITVAAAAMAIAAPLLAAVLGGMDRRRLLALSLVWYAAGHALCALAPSLTTLTPLRAATVLAAAVFTPQAAAAIGTLASPAQRAGAITFVFLGWSIASVAGMPLHSFIGETFGWRWAFALVALLSVAGAAWVWRAMPDGVHPPALNLAAWRSVFTHPALMGIVAVTALSGAGQFTLFSYIAPYYRQVLQATPLEISLLFAWFGAFGLLGNVLLTRVIDRVGPARAVAALLVTMAVSLALWPLAGSVAAMALVIAPWGLGCFASNSAQQARLGLASPAYAPALLSLNTSAIYLGQAVGAATGGAMVAAATLAVATPGGTSTADTATTYAGLPVIGLVFLACALALSVWADRRLRGTAA